MTSPAHDADTRVADTGRRPLAGITVLDLCAYIAGPYGCTLLADPGAQVVKVEPPGGDNLRKYPSTLADESRAFLGVNRGKQGPSLDLKQPEALDILHRLLATADVLGASSPRQLPGFRTRSVSRARRCRLAAWCRAALVLNAGH